MLAAPGSKALLVSAWLWHTSRWCGLFSCGYLVTKATHAHAPLLNQLVGVTLFAPMILGGLLAGAASDRVDRRRLVMGTELVLIPISLAMFALVQQDVVRVWMVYPFMFTLGVGGLVNMTAQRPLIYETVGAERAARVLTLETVIAASASAIGALLGGTIIGTMGIAASFALVAAMLCVSVALLTRVPRPARVHDPGAGAPLRTLVDSSIVAVRGSRSLASMLGVTVIFNFWFSSFVPLVPVMAARLAASAVMTGVLTSAIGGGALLGGLVLTSAHVKRRGHVYVGGSVLSLVGLGLFASAPALGVAFAALVAAGLGQAGFSAMQSLLAIDAMGSAGRGASLGLLSTAIGTMPIGMLVVGLGAQWQGPRVSLLASSLTGLVVLGLWLRRRPEVLRPS
jgi:predicted MFS family arabinose efflux permease